MARSWGPVTKPVEHNVKGIAADAEGAVTEPHPGSRERGPAGFENYNATDGRHNKADHQGWPSLLAADTATQVLLDLFRELGVRL